MPLICLENQANQVKIKIVFMKRIIVLASLFLVIVFNASAEGYQVNLQSSKQAGMGHAGASLKLGAESMHFNPAGLSFMKENISLSAGASAIFGSMKYKSTSGDYKHKTDNPIGTPLYLYAGFKIYDNLAAGVSVTTPYGSSINWGVNWAGSRLVQDISLKSFSIQPTVSYRPFDRLSFGAGLMVMYGDFSLSRALIPAGGLEALRQTPFAPLIKDGLDLLKDIDAASATLAGDAGVKIGYNVGAMYDVSNKITLGVSYRSKVTMKVPEGHATMNYANEAALNQILTVANTYLPADKKIGVPPLDRGTFTAELPLPSNLNIAVSYKPTDRLLLTGEVQFVGWSAYDKLNVQFSQEVLDGYSINAPKMYENTCIYRLGGQFAATNRLDLRLGAYYDESPVPSEFLNPETPSMNKFGLTTGLSFRPLQRLSIDMAFAYVTGFGRDGSYPYDPKDLTKTFGGHYEVNAFNSSLGISYAF